MKPKKITIEELAIITNNCFEAQTKLMMEGFDRIDKKFETVNENFKKVFVTLKAMDDKLDDMGSLKHRVDYIENVLNIQPLKQ